MHFYLNKRKAIFAGVFILLLHPFDEGSLLADAPLVAGYERLKQDDQSTSIERGELLLGELNCTSCHEADATITARVWPRTAPDLSTAGARLTPHYLQSYLSDPQSKKSGVTMPNIFHASEAAAKDGAIDFLVHFLASQGGGLKPNRMGGSDSLVEQGRKLFHGIGCVACHGPEEAANDGMRYQSLDSLPEKTTLDALVEFLKDPHATRPSGRMPDLRLDASEARAIGVYLLRDQLSNPQSVNADPGEEPGIAFEYYELDNLRSLPDFANLEPKFKGELDSISLNLPQKGRNSNFAVRYFGHIKIPTAGKYRFGTASDDGSAILINGDTVVDNDGIHGRRVRMGEVELSAGNHDFEVHFFNGGGGSELRVFWAGPGIEGRRGSPIPKDALVRNTGKPMIPLGTQPFTLDSQKVRMGAQMFTALRCVSCHSMNDWKPMRPAMRLSDLNVNNAEGCLGDSIRRGAPDYELSDNQRSDIMAALKSYEKSPSPLTPAETVQRTLASFNCYACHERDGIGGPSDMVASKYFNTAIEIDLGEEGKIPPSLNHVGAKLKPEAMASILTSDKFHVRHYMATRMPAFPESVAQSFVKAVGEVDDQPAFAKESDFSEEAAGIGQKFIGVTGLACITCHRVAGQDSLAIQGIDLSSVYDRIQPGWFKAFLLDPASFKKDTRMPQFWPEGQSAFQDILGGDAEKQIDSIWSYLSLKNSMPFPVGIVPKGAIAMELVPADKPIVHRTFMKDVGPRTVLTGFPEKLNVAYDFNVVRMAKVWRGRFFDHSGVQSGRTDTFLDALGTDVLELPSGPAFAFLDAPQTAWPQPELTSRNIGGQFKGYSLDQETDRPIFKYQLETASIEEAPAPVIQPGGAILRRIFKIKADSASNGLHFLAAEGDEVEQLSNDRFRVGDNYEVQIRGSFPLKPIIRVQGKKTQILIPVPLDQGEASVEQFIEW